MKGSRGRNTVQGGGTESPLLGKFARTTLTVLLVALGIGLAIAWRTNDAMADLPFLRKGMRGQEKTLVDETPWKTAQTLAALAVSQEELTFARQAERLADHEVDQAFATALREQNLKQRTLTGEALELQKKVTQLTALVASDQVALNSVAKGSDDEDIAKAQLGLDQDQLDDAKGDLARASGDERGAIQQELTAREASMKQYDAAGGVGNGQVAVLAVSRYRTLSGLVTAWRSQNNRYALVLQAQAAAQSDAANLTTQHNALEQAATTSGNSAAANAGTMASSDRLTGLKRMALQRELVTLYDDRIATENRLADVYGRWATQLTLQHRIVAHLIVVQVMIVLVILIIGIVLSALARRIAERETADRRRARTLSWIARLSVQGVMLLAILMVVFGSPSQLSTVIGLVTAGLTVALQDFILAFVGWFILMGKSGVGVGDAVEINGVSGEVVEIGVFRTTLLETGNWASAGHPTGRRVAFNNKYAISGQYFNFSTSGQWLWDEFTVTVPVDQDVAATMGRVLKTVTEATAEDAKAAEAEWAQVSRQRGLSQFSAEPAVNVRPAGSGAELVVRYVTRAAGRFERRSSLSELVLKTLRVEAPAK
ncbi:mechanosensitive ion channel [Granulicella sp. 5B5]|uniref:mechanosensitive ion channel family protein n=1 Tax=Granulicella sp. 5B5 TaxID=1617967 RepID=UPI0015F42F26|nr:mechanosensitive ion channel domain-containing protein [Granulicella sp. 5B5]QMV18191.1 mechanosensitive ion channel [Granulicella sp. 5B5]